MSVIGILMDVYWIVLFKSFYSAIRVKVVVRDVSRILSGRVIEMSERFYMLTFDVEALGPPLLEMMFLPAHPLLPISLLKLRWIQILALPLRNLMPLLLLSL